MNNELISVIIPTYKRTETLKRAIESVKNQTYKNIEIIVVDDNANFPEERKKVEQIVNCYSDIRLIKNDKNLGGGLSRNEGIKVANGKYIGFLDDDDEFNKQKIEEQYSLLKNKEKEDKRVGLIYCYSKYIYTKTMKQIKKDYEGIPLKEHMVECIAATSWWLCPKKVLEDIRGFSNISSHQDATLILNLLSKGYSVYRVPQVLLNYYVHNGEGITKINKKWIMDDIEYREKCRKQYNKLSKHEIKEVEYSFSRRIANMAIIIGDLKMADEEIKVMLKNNFFAKDTLKMLLKRVFRKKYLNKLEDKNSKR